MPLEWFGAVATEPFPAFRYQRRCAGPRAGAAWPGAMASSTPISSSLAGRGQGQMGIDQLPGMESYNPGTPGSTELMEAGLGSLAPASSCCKVVQLIFSTWLP